MKRFFAFILTALMCFSVLLTGCDEQSAFTVTFDGNGGVLVSGEITQTVDSADQIIEPTFEKQGFIFVGWNKIISQISSSTTVKAQWKAESFTVTFNGNGGTLVEGQSVQTVDAVSKIVLPKFVKTGYTLSWDTEINSISQTTTVNAIWTANNYILSFKTNGGNIDSAFLNGITVTYGQPIGTLPNPTKDGFDFDHWHIGSNKITSDTIWLFDGNNQAVAEYLLETEYKISYDLSGGTADNNPSNYTKSTSDFTLNNPTKTGYEFMGWTSDNILVPSTSVTIQKGSTGNLAFTANWRAKQFTLTLDKGLGQCDEDSKEVVFGEQVGVLPECARDGYQFLGWYLNGEQISSDTVWLLDGHATLVAEYLKADEYSIQYKLNGGRIDSSPVKYTVLTETFTINNPTKTGYEFMGWTSDTILVPNTSVTIEKGSTGNLTFTANWRANSYKIIFNADGGNLDGDYADGMSVVFDEVIGTLPVPTKDGYEFGHWNIEASTVTENTVWKYASNMQATAVYIKLTEYSITYDLDGGTASSNPANYVKTDADFTLNNPTKEGYEFIGWTSDTILVPTISVTIVKGSTGNLAFTANWKKMSYTIELDADGGTCLTNKITVTYGEAIGTLPVPAKDGYEFSGWYLGDVLVDADTAWSVTSAQKLVAKYTRIYEVRYELSCVYGKKVVTATVNGQSSLPSVFVKEGQTLEGLLPDKKDIVFMDPEEYSFYAWVNLDGKKLTEDMEINETNFSEASGGIIYIIIKCQTVNTKFY